MKTRNCWHRLKWKKLSWRKAATETGQAPFLQKIRIRKGNAMRNPIIEKLLAKTRRTDIPKFGPGDTIKVQVKIREGEKERLQAFEGVVIARKRGAQPSFTVRKISFGQGVERIFPIDSKVIDKIDVVRSAKVRRAKLYYLRGLKGKAARLKEVEQQ